MSRRSLSTSYSIFTCSSLASHCSRRSTTPVDKVRRGDIQGNIQLFERILSMGPALGFEAYNCDSFHVSRKFPSLPKVSSPAIGPPIEPQYYLPHLGSTLPLGRLVPYVPSSSRRYFRSPTFRRDARGLVLRQLASLSYEYSISLAVRMTFKPSPSSQFHFAWQVYALSQRPFMKYVVSGAVVVLSLLAFGECVAREQLLSVDGFYRAFFNSWWPR